MGVVQLTILTMVNMMGSGIIMLPTKLAEVGTISILSWLVTALGSTALAYAYAFAKCGMFSKKQGGLGGYAEYAFGKSGNFLSNYTYSTSLLIANIAIAISAVGYGVAMINMGDFELVLAPVGVCLAIIALLVITTIFTPTIGFIVTSLAVLACVGFFPKVFTHVNKAGAPVKGMLILLGIQCALALMTISPSLSKQFEILVNLAVITNILPYILAMAGLVVMQKVAKVDVAKAKFNSFIAAIGALFSLYAIYSAGEEAMMYGALATFLGWLIYGFIAHKFEKLEE